MVNIFKNAIKKRLNRMLSVCIAAILLFSIVSIPVPTQAIPELPDETFVSNHHEEATQDSWIEAEALDASLIQPLQAIQIHNAMQLEMFLRGMLGTNNAHVTLMADINMSGMGPYRGRGFVDGIPFSGVFDGNGRTISNLQLTPRGFIEDAATLSLNDVGLFRALGHGAVIQDLTLDNVTFSDPGGTVAGWDTAIGNIGLVAGRVMPASQVTMNNINVNSGSITFSGARRRNNKRVGGVVGVVDTGSALNLTNINVGTEATALSIAFNMTGTDGGTAERNIPFAGGIVGLTAGSVNLLGTQNTVNLTTAVGSVGGNREIRSAGGAVGGTSGSAHVVIENLTVRGTIRANRQAGGVIGSTSNAGTTTIRNTVNYSAVSLFNWVPDLGGNGSMVGGFVGWARNRTYIRNGENRGAITHPGHSSSSPGAAGARSRRNVAFGGFIGRAHGILEMHNVENFAHVQQTESGRSRGGGIVGHTNNLVNITNAVNHGNVGSVATGGGDFNSGMGGIIGYVQFAGTAVNRWVRLNDTQNHGNIGVNATGGAATRLRNGGIVGVTRTRSGVRGLVIINALNTGHVDAIQVAGGILGWNQSDRTTIDGVVNRGNVHVTAVGANRCAGGIVGRSARHDLTVIRAGNEGNITSGGGTSTSTNTALSGVGGIVGNINRGNRNRIMQSYNAGSVTGGTATVGGIVGQVRRGGTTLIQDSYNVGTVHSRRGNHGTSGTPRWTGNGILGHRGSAPRITIERVFNGGNVSGRAIFGYSNTGAVTRRMIYRQVYWDIDTFTGPQLQAGAPGIQGVPTAILTSGIVRGLSTGNWLINSWLTEYGLTRPYQQWESYPYLAWQTGTRYTTPGPFTRGDLQADFFTRIDPGASHDMVASPTTVNFYGVLPNVRTFNPYETRPTTAHQLRPTGNSALSVSRGANHRSPRMSVGLISPAAVVGFGENELFEAIIMAIDSTTLRPISHSRIYQNGFFIQPQYYGIAGPGNITLADTLTATALGYVMDPNWVLTQAELDRGIVHIMMDRAPIENLRVHIINADAVADDPTPIHQNRNPQLRRRSHLPSSSFVPVTRQGSATVPFFDISGAMWGENLDPSARLFELLPPYVIELLPEEVRFAELEFYMIVRGAGTPGNPWIAYVHMTDIDPGALLLDIVRTHDNDTEYGFTGRLPHGGRVTTVQANPAVSNNFTVEFRSPQPPIDGVNPMALAGTGSGTGTTDAANRWNVNFASTRCEIRVTPTWANQIGGTLGANFSYRTTGWHLIEDLLEFDDDGNQLRLIEVPVEPEVPVPVRVVEEFTIAGRPWSILIPPAALTLSYDAGDPVMRTHNIPGNNTGNFLPRLISGDLLDASAPGFMPNSHEVDDGDVYPDPFPTPDAGYVRYPIYIPLTRETQGRIHGFVINATMLDDPDAPKVPINGARVTIFNQAGEVVGTTTTGPDGYYYFTGLPRGQNYSVIATATGFGAGDGVPTPVYLPENLNAEAHVFLRANQGTEGGFRINLFITETGTTNNLGAISTATLTFGANQTRTSTFVTPFRTFDAPENTTVWRGGEIVITVSEPGFSPVTIDNLGGYIDAQPANVAQGFIIINVEMSRMFDLTVSNVPAGLTHIGQSGTASGSVLANMPGTNSVLFDSAVVLNA
ncbi:MAG: carboxypeptidase-like regulatory domain-containing protein, partial [Oscillospiraceae bacterium]|nr:carboxypeptidase-like regulatory domain-containing protein [Oscillospiraceae bacterium]